MRYVFTALTVSSLLALSATANAAPINRADIPLLVGTSPYLVPVTPSEYQGADSHSIARARDISATPCADDCASRADVRWNLLPPALEQ